MWAKNHRPPHVLVMTATPIPRTLQFSIMGARDLSMIQTPPPNRYPIHTEIHTFDADIIKEAINNLISMRQKEGEKISEDILAKISQIEAKTEGILDEILR